MSTETPAKGRARSAPAQEKPARPGYGEVGPAVYRRVKELKGEGDKLSTVFEKVGQEFNIKPTTVSANYYRIARSQGEGRGPRVARRQVRDDSLRSRLERVEQSYQDLKRFLEEIEEDIEYARMFKEFIAQKPGVVVASESEKTPE